MTTDQSLVLKQVKSIARQFNANNETGTCCGDLSALEVWALEILRDTENCSMRQLAESIDYTISGATRLINRLEKRDYAQRYQSTEDGRVCCVKITPAAVQALEEIEAHLNQRIQTALDRIPTDQHSQFFEFLTQFSQGLETTKQ